MNPFCEEIKFTLKKKNHFYAIKNKKGEFLKIENPKIGQKVYEIPSISGGEQRAKLILEIPIPLCKKHFDSHKGKKFGVTTCRGWDYIAIPVELGSTICRECKNELFIPMPYLSSANLSSANLSSANLRSANLSYADLSSANLSSANLRSADLSSANLSYADLSSANLSYADLRSADLSYANLRSANLRSANLRSADLRSANLRSADLSSANLRSADLSYARNLEYAYWNKFTIIDEEFKKLLSKDRFLK